MNNGESETNLKYTTEIRLLIPLINTALNGSLPACFIAL